MVSTHCLLLLGLLVASGYGHTSAMGGSKSGGNDGMSGDMPDDLTPLQSDQVQAFPSHYIIPNEVSYSDNTCVRNGSDVLCSRGKKKSPILMDCGLGPKDSIPHVTQAYILQNRRPRPYTFKIAFYFNEPFTLDSVLLFHYYNRRCFNVSLKIDNTPLTMKKCSTNFNSGTNQRQQSVININEDFDLEIDGPLVVEIRLPPGNVLNLTEVMFFKKGSGNGIITEPVEVDGPVNNKNFVICSASASSCGIIWKWEHKSQTPINNINIKDDRVILPDEDQMIFKSTLVRIRELQKGKYSCTATRQYVKKEVEEDGDYCCFVVNDKGDGSNTSTEVLIGALFGTLAALMLCIVVVLIIIAACVACHIRKSKTNKTEPVTDDGLANPAYSPGAMGLITDGKDRAVADNGLANPVYYPGTMGVVAGPSTAQCYSKHGAFVEPEYAVLDAPPLPPNPQISSTAQKYREPDYAVLEETTAANTQTSPTQRAEYAVLEGPTHPEPKTSTNQENEEADDSSDPVRTEEQDPISYEVLTPKHDPQYSHLNHNTRPTESPDPTYSHLNHTGGPAETGPDPATIHLDSDEEQDPLPYEIPVKK